MQILQYLTTKNYDERGPYTMLEKCSKFDTLGPVGDKSTRIIKKEAIQLSNWRIFGDTVNI
jgi:hypothetical protein